MNDKTFGRDSEIIEVDDAEVIHRGEPMSEARAEMIAAEMREELRAKRLANLQPGRKSIGAPGAHSPVIQFRVPTELRELAATVAEREGMSLSKLSRRALDEYLQRHAG